MKPPPQDAEWAMPEHARSRVFSARMRQQQQRQLRIIKYMPAIERAVQQCKHATQFTSHRQSGCVSFYYIDRRVQYYVSAFKLMVSRRDVYSVYDNFTPQEFSKQIRSNDPTKSFLL